MNEQELVLEFERQNITLAPIFKRAIAFIVDEFIVSILVVFIFFGQLQNITTQEDIIKASSFLAPYILVIKILYQTFFVWAYGASPGKMLMRIKVIYILTISKPTFFIAFLRSCGRIVSETFFYIGFLWAFFNPKRETWQDIAAKTLVINA